MEAKAKKRCKISPAAIKASVESADYVETLLIVWRDIEPRWDDLVSVCPWEYEVPKTQASQILAGRAAISEMGGIWLNNGPSTYDDVAEREAKRAAKIEKRKSFYAQWADRV